MGDEKQLTYNQRLKAEYAYLSKHVEQRRQNVLRKLASCKPGAFGRRVLDMSKTQIDRQITIVLADGKRESIRANKLSGLGHDQERVSKLASEIEKIR